MLISVSIIFTELGASKIMKENVVFSSFFKINWRIKGLILVKFDPIFLSIFLKLHKNPWKFVEKIRLISQFLRKLWPFLEIFLMLNLTLWRANRSLATAKTLLRVFLHKSVLNISILFWNHFFHMPTKFAV